MSSRTDFNALTSATEIAATYSEILTGKTIIVTGVSPDGLGLATAAAFASQRPQRLILTGRSPEKVQTSISTLEALHPGVQYDALIMDLSSTASVRAAAAKLNGDKSVPTVDILVNNAGVMALPDLQLSEDGIEMTFATNHVGHFLFTNLILPKIIKAAEMTSTLTRIINVSSYGHQFSPIRFSDINFSKILAKLPEEESPDLQKASFLTGQDWSDKSYVGFLSYGQSKTANILFSVSLTEKLEAKYGIRSYAIHPGAVTTNINRHAKPEEIEQALKRVKELGFETLAKTPDQGANSSVLSAVDTELPSPDLSGLEAKGLYMADCKLDDEQCAGFARNKEYADRLWALSEELVKEKFDI
ncbi:hypothetical protein BDP55DRAFT_659048 [Colletotrichum godetiae]|uniref:Short-chain dehydrogenase n=1 Tax=Colletotrichum godetiae TaxID=1209918 RepID=A0AAJ0ANW2_9PEZI|nr:uncharacterized protein BDP55DRAFT_659048 [Colletotrichum godetiae]KAK1687667.1 hypothetical protein BDP55DRAFT_659048 [Colletotrichum godetiae]